MSGNGGNRLSNWPKNTERKERKKGGGERSQDPQSADVKDVRYKEHEVAKFTLLDPSVELNSLACDCLEIVTFVSWSITCPDLRADTALEGSSEALYQARIGEATDEVLLKYIT
ncbi:hypothetical protein R1flu_000481 [Riccia fluitans]|uniref:Uncharacterized protein n=1 Tax=Riccia fluitans TaxID=41844 RepID=A0ABD1Y0K3_9MARC